MAVGKLKDRAVLAAKPKTKPYKLADGGGLYVEVMPNGSKFFRLKFRNQGKEGRITFGAYPVKSLAEARMDALAAKKVLASGANPVHAREQEKLTLAEDTFGALFAEWVETQRPDWAESNLKKITALADANLLPYLRERPVKSVKPQELLSILRRIESRNALELARRCGSILMNVFALALGSGRSESNPAIGLNGLLKKHHGGHRAAITDPTRMANLMRNIAGYSGGPVVRAALRLSALTFLRPGELRQAEWADVDFEKGEWLIPVRNRKLKRVQKRTAQPHWVPLSQQAISELRELHKLTGRSRFVFPGERSPNTRPMSDGAVLAALRSMGYDTEAMSAHGFRGMATSSLMEQGWKREAIDRQLAHKDKDAVFAAYDRADYREERRLMMQAWADYLDGLINRSE